MTRYSLAEIEAQCRKAARGAGYAWGLAEEAGRAARWLEARALPGAEVLSRLLVAQDGCDYHALRPHTLDAVWQARAEALCPLITGVTLADCGFDPPPRVGVVREPLLLIPFLHHCGLTYPSLNELKVAASIDLSDTPFQRGIIAVAEVSPESRDIDAGIWSTLAQFAHRTYVPATEASRAGAGAGTTDND